MPEYRGLVQSRIAAAALKVFSEKGYHQSTVEEISQEAGFSKPTFYEYVEGKGDLLEAIARASQEFTERSLSIQGRDPMEILENNFKNLVQSRRGLHLGFEITSLSSHDESIRALNRGVYDAKRTALVNFVRNQQRLGRISPRTSAPVAAQLLIAIYTDLSTQLILGYPDSEVHQWWSRCVEAVLGGEREGAHPVGMEKPLPRRREG